MRHTLPARRTYARSLRLVRIAAAIPLAMAAVGSPLRAQQAIPSSGDSRVVEPPSDSSTTNSPTRIAGKGTAYLAMGLAGAAVVTVPFDVAITRRLRSPDLQQSTAWRNGAIVFDWYGAPGARAVGPLLAVAGSLARNPTMSDIGIHVSESYATAAVAVFIVKGIAGRARPYTVSSDRAYDFEFGRGYPHREPYSSFPSGHATGSFAFASSITVEATRHWPKHAKLIGALAYGGAFLDGVSRVYRDMHWPSDVAAGALLGTMSGLLVTRRQHAHPDNRVDALARRVLFAPTADGRMAVGVVQSF